jgi:hypothetical protein
MARRRDHVAVNISRGARRARLGVLDEMVGRHLDIFGRTPTRKQSYNFSRFTHREPFSMTTPPAVHSSGAHIRRCGISSCPRSKLGCPVYRFRGGALGGFQPDEPRFPRVRVQRHTRAEATREATGEAHFVALRAGRAFATGSSSGVGGRRRERVNASEPLCRVPFRDLPSPAARLPSARDGRGVHVAEGILRGVAGDRLPRRRPESRAHSRRGCVPSVGDPILTPPRRLASPRLVVPRPRSPPSPLHFPPPRPRSRRKQNRGGAR